MKQLNLFFIFILSLLLFSCEEDESVPKSEVQVQITLPEGVISKSNITFDFTNVNTGKTETVTSGEDGLLTQSIAEGVYNVVAIGSKIRTKTLSNDETVSQEVSLRGFVENFAITGASVNLDIELTVAIESNGFILKELYFSGSKTPENKSYYKDKYFEIYNNTNITLYADGISLVESDHVTVFEDNDWASVVDITQATVAGVIYTIPGSGMDYPVLPGKSIILCDIGIDHTVNNANSFDLSTADFEWYDDVSFDVDVPEVPNLIKNHSYSRTIWTPHGRGYKSYLIFKQEGSMKDFLAANMVQVPNASGTRMMTAYKIPNDLVLDAVEVSTQSKYASKAFDPSLDLTFTHCGDSNNSLYGKCVRRKVLKNVEGRIVYQDTNNSAEDFESTVTPKPGVN